ncbi:hypothetical protein GCM10028825_15370 [Spirosoma agri]
MDDIFGWNIEQLEPPGFGCVMRKGEHILTNTKELFKQVRANEAAGSENNDRALKSGDFFW